mmetsp:Transcript_8344/g.12725  ORF Transcript_8344/g.12725 Transcript_8344/m.12725 type:complete len:135 (-) Transcript_8344:678-1082(-)
MICEKQKTSLFHLKKIITYVLKKGKSSDRCVCVCLLWMNNLVGIAAVNYVLADITLLVSTSYVQGMITGVFCWCWLGRNGDGTLVHGRKAITVSVTAPVWDYSLFASSFQTTTGGALSARHLAAPPCRHWMVVG